MHRRRKKDMARRKKKEQKIVYNEIQTKLKRTTKGEGAETYEATCLRVTSSLRAAKLKLIFLSNDKLVLRLAVL